MKRTLGAAASFAAAVLTVLFVLLHAAEASRSAYGAMVLAAQRVVPSLFPLCVLAIFLIESGEALNWRFFAPVMRALRLDAGAAPACILGMLCGFPIGAAVLCDLYGSGAVQKRSAERALALCSCASPAFVIGIAGRMLGSPLAGALLLAVHWAAAAAAALLLSRGASFSDKHPPQKAKKPLPAAFTAAVQRAALSMVQICGFIVLFSVVLCLLDGIIGRHAALNAAVGAILELTNGLDAISKLNLSPRAAFILSAAALGWSGLCVHAQILSLALPCGLSSKPYFKGKALQSAISLALAVPLSRLLPSDMPALARILPAETPPTIPTLWACGFIALFFYLLFPAMRSIMRKKHMG